MGPTDIIFLGVRLQEIDVILTDLLWSGVNFWCFARLSTSVPAQAAQAAQLVQPVQPVQSLSSGSLPSGSSPHGTQALALSPAGQWFRYMFLLMGIAVLLGAFLGHGFQYALGYEAKYPGWIISMWGVACFERAAILYAGERVSPRLGRIMSVANLVELAIFHALILFSQLLFDFNAFFLVEVHAGYGLLIIALPLHGYIYYHTRAAASKYVLFGIATAALALLVHLTNFYLHPVWFNFHDVSHVVLTAATLLYYQAARRMRSEVAAPAFTVDHSRPSMAN